jgi:large repetitive protein
MDNLIVHKLLKNKATKASVLTLILLLSLSLPILMLPAVSAAGTVSISPTSGPNGTAVKVTGSGFGPSESYTAFTVLVDGLGTKATLTGSGLANNNRLATTAAGVITGEGAGKDAYIILGGAGGLNLAAGTHTVQIYDATAAPLAVSFTITLPTVTLTPSTGPAGTSVKVTASGFTQGVGGGIYAVTDTITAASFAGTGLAIAAGTVTASAATLSSNSISATGGYTATVSLPAITSGASFTLTDNFGNIATTAWTLNAPTLTLSPASGPIGTVVTATVTGYGPGATFSNVQIGNTATPSTIATLVPAAPAVTEQGTAAFLFVVAGATPDFAAGTQTISVTDSLGNKATSSFTITPQATITLGAGGVNSGVAFAPTGALTVASYLSVNGFKPSTLLSLTSSAGVPAGWVTFLAASITTDVNGQIAVPVLSTATGTAPSSGVYSVIVSDGTNSVTVFLTITNSANFFVISPTSGAQGTTVTLTGFGAAPTTAIMFDGSTIGGATQCAANAWPAVPTTYGIFTVPSSGAGVHSVTTTGIAGAATFTNTGAPIVTVVSPDPAADGTKATIVVSGVAKNAANTLLSLTMDSITTTVTSSAFAGTYMVASFIVPTFPAAAHAISATDSFFNTASSSLTNTLSSVSVTPNSGVVALATTSISITASAFPMTSAITVLFDSTTLAAATVGCQQTNTNGGIIIYTTVIPITVGATAGAHTISLQAGASTATTTFIVQPTIAISPTAIRPVESIPASQKVGVTGFSFAANSALTLLINGTATAWYNTATFANTTTIQSDAVTGAIPAGFAVVIPPSTLAGKLNVTVVDAAGNSAQKSGNNALTVLGIPTITLEASQGLSAVGTVRVKGTNFTPGAARAATINFISGDGSTVLFPGIQVTNPMAVTADGTFAYTAQSFTVPAATAGTYIISLTLTTPTESANATFIILGIPTVSLNATTAKVGDVIITTIVGINNPISTQTIGGTPLGLNTTTVTTTGTNAYNLSAQFTVPTIPAGQYTVLVGDGTRSATTALNVTPSITLTPNTGLKGSTTVISGNGFGPTSVVSVKFNGVAVTTTPAAQSTDASGILAAGVNTVTITIPVTAVASNTVTVTDALGNSATALYNVTAPTLLATPATGGVGTTVQLIGSGFTASSPMVVQVGGAVVVTAPVGITGDSFLAYIQIPAGTPAGSTVITATDAKNNVAIVQFNVTSGGTGGTFAVDSTALSTSAQTLAGSSPSSTFARGTSVKVQFVLQTTTGSGNVIWRVTFQKADLTATVVSSSAGLTTSAATEFTQLPLSSADPAGTWTAQIQVFASDGVTALAVKTLTFTVT